MKDLIVLLMTFGFFGLCVAYVALCDRIVGPDPDPEAVAGPETDAVSVEAGAVSVDAGALPVATATTPASAR